MTEKWGIYEIELGGPTEGNPFTDIQLSGRFCLGDKQVEAERLEATVVKTHWAPYWNQ